MKRIRILCITAMLALAGVSESFAASFDVGPGVQNIPFEMLMENVDPYMLNADYWTDGPGNKRILMNEYQIRGFNEDCLDNPDCCMHRLSSIEPVFDGISLRDALASFSAPSNLYLNREPVPASFYEAIRKQIAGAPVQSSMNLGYAICIKRCVQKNLPCAESLADDVTDPEWDQLALSPVLFNEPLVTYITTADGRFTYCKSEICDGWVPTDSIVLCHSKEEWEAARNPEQFLVVTGDKIQTEKSYLTAHSEVTFEMGTRLELSYSGRQTVDNRMNWYNFVVNVPGRGADGLYEKQPMLIPVGSDVHPGWLPLTRENIVRQAFKSLGTRYGWGGSEDAQDCSSFVREVYLCFGLNLPRNTTWQGAVHAEKIDLSAMSLSEKKTALAGLPAGTILQFPGHEMLYLGERNGKYYTVNNVSSLAEDTENGLKKIRTRSVVINSLEDTRRPNGKTWLSELNKAIVLFR